MLECPCSALVKYRVVCAFAGQEELEHNHPLICNFAVHFAHKSFDAKLDTSKGLYGCNTCVTL